jgi:hypothetical protein
MRPWARFVEEQTIDNLPLNGRNFTFLAQLSAGVTQGQQDSRGLGASGSFAANGLRPAQNNYLLDGMDDNANLVDFLNGTAYSVKPPVDAIQEFKIRDQQLQRRDGPVGRSRAERYPQVGDKPVSWRGMGVLAQRYVRCGQLLRDFRRANSVRTSSELHWAVRSAMIRHSSSWITKAHAFAKPLLI